MNEYKSKNKDVKDYKNPKVLIDYFKEEKV
jgi:hypothetical protein